MKEEIPAPVFNFAFWNIISKSEDKISTTTSKNFHQGEVNCTSRRWASGEQRLPTPEVSVKQATRWMNQTYTCSLFSKVTKENHRDRSAGIWTILSSFPGKQRRGLSNHQAGSQVTIHQPGKVPSRTFQIQQSTGLFCLSILWGFFHNNISKEIFTNSYTQSKKLVSM